MNIYMIVVYPNRKGLSYAAYEQARRGLSEAGHDIRVSNLYEDGFDPVLSFDQEHPRHNLQHDEATAAYRENVVWADHLVFVFPIWWGGMPAMLKGFVDRVFAKGFAYEYRGLRPIGLLPNKTAWIITTNDTPAIYAKLFSQDYGTVLKRQVLAFCGIRTLKRSTMFLVRGSKDVQRRKWLDGIYRTARTLKLKHTPMP